MTVASNQSGSQTAVISTEHTLGTAITTAGVFVLVVDTANMVNGDVLELRLYTKYASGGTERQAYFASFSNVQGSPNLYSVPVPSDTSFKATLKQTAGTGRVFPWNILSL
jgi:hypothetical protein